MENQPQTTPAAQQDPSAGLSGEAAIIALLQRQNQLLEQIQATLLDSIEDAGGTKKNYRLKVAVKDSHISFGGMMNILFTWVFASIPVGIVVGVVYVIINALIYSSRYR